MRSGAKTLIIPEENLKDVEELPREVKENLEIITVNVVDQVFERALL